MLPDTSSVALVLGLTLVAAAAPATSGTHSSTPFSYSQWVEGIIANPDGLNLSVEEVIEVTKNDTFARNGELTRKDLRRVYSLSLCC